jgi:ADP-heptose:LPS heptosyltransferase
LLELKKILLISTNALGDTYLTCAAFKSLKDFFKKVRIDIVSTENARFILEEIGFDNLYLLEKKSFAEMHLLVSKIRKTKYDIVFNFFPGQMNSSFFKLSSAEEKIGFTNFIKRKSWHNDEDILKTKSQLKSKITWKPEDNYLDRISMSLKSAGIETEVNKHVFNFSDVSTSDYDIVLHLFSSDTYRKINPDSIKKIISELCEKQNKKVCLIGSEKEISDMKGLNGVKNLQIEINPDIKKLEGLILNTKLFIGVDSFPIHIADAYNTKTLGIFYYNNERSVFQNMDNKYIFRVTDNSLNVIELLKFIKEKKLF